jgi:hypothetical protein
MKEVEKNETQAIPGGVKPLGPGLGDLGTILPRFPEMPGPGYPKNPMVPFDDPTETTVA